MNFELHGRKARIQCVIRLVCLLCFVISWLPFNALATRATAANEDALQVNIDIRPGKKINTIRIDSKGSVPIAILSTQDFDAKTIDPLTVRFGPQGTAELHAQGHLKDVNRDGRPDLLLHFNIRSAGIGCGDLKASLTGMTYAGHKIEGNDNIRVTGCKKIPKHPTPR